MAAPQQATIWKINPIYGRVLASTAVPALVGVLRSPRESTIRCAASTVLCFRIPAWKKHRVGGYARWMYVREIYSR